MAPKSEREKNQHIQVVVRCRPLNSTERKQGSYSIVDVQQDRHEVRVKERNIPTAQPKCFTFDKVFGPRAEQIEVYKTVMTPMIEEVLQGYNCTVFAYGQTGTGKTYTMNGANSSDESMTWENDPQAGIIPRAMQQLFTHLESQDVEFSVKVSYLEIYNEELVDLLGAESVDNPKLRIYEDAVKKGSCVISGLEEVIVRSREEVHSILEQGSCRRQTAATLMNAQSSRSHSLFMLTVHIKESNIAGEEMLKIGKLNLVDLAGSECIGRSGATDRRAREAGQINQSLLTLGRVITALVDHAPHVPYRESKLTRLLQDSLGGRTKTSIIATISPALINLDETMSTLNYANTAKSITNRPEVNAKLTKRAMLKGYEEEIERLRRDLQAARDKNGVYIASENYEAMQTEIIQKTEFIKDLEEQLEILTTEKTKLEDIFEETKRHLEDTTVKLTHTRKTLKSTRQDRDEQCFLVGKHEDTEQKLYSEAETLLSTAELSTDHVSRLHDKIARKTDVEMHNDNVTSNYEVQLHANIDSMKRSLNSFTDKQTAMGKQIKHDIDDLLTVRQSEVDILDGELTTLQQAITDKLDTLQTSHNEHVQTSINWTDSATQKINAFRDDEVSRQFDFHEQTFLACVDILHKHQAAHTANLKQQKLKIQQQMESQQVFAQKYFTDITAQLMSHQKLIDEFASEHTEKLTTIENATEEMSNEQLTINQTMMDLVSNLSSTVQEQQDKLGAFQQILSKQSAAKKKVSEFHTQTQTSHGEHVELVQQFNTRLTGQTRLHAEETENNLDQIINDTFTEEFDDMKDKMTEFSQQSQKSILGHSQEMMKTISEHNSHLQRAEAQTKQISNLSEYTNNTLTPIAATQTQQNAAWQEKMSTHTQSITKQNVAITDWFADHDHAIATLDEDTTKFTNIELRKDVPTGATPQRQAYTYPQTLAKTDRRSVLLKNFRKDYVLDEAMKVPIPNDSFNESFNDDDLPVIKLDDKALVNDDNEIHNDCDTHSQISNDSAISSVSSKDIGAKENIRSTMRAPKSRPLVSSKIQSRTQSGSRATPNSTPTTKLQSDVSKKASHSAPKSRIRLPLRSKSPN